MKRNERTVRKNRRHRKNKRGSATFDSTAIERQERAGEIHQLALKFYELAGKFREQSY